MMPNEEPPRAPAPQPEAPAPGQVEITIQMRGPGDITVNGQPVPDVAQALEMVQELLEGGQPAGPDQEKRDMDDAMEGYGRGGLRGVPIDRVLRDDR